MDPAIYKVTEDDRRENLEESKSRTRILPTLSPKLPQKKSISQCSMTEDEIKVFCKQHIDNMIHSKKADDYISALMACYGRSSKATVWEQNVTPFFLLA